VLFHEEAWLSIKKLVAELQKLGNHNHLKAYRRYRSAFALRCLERLAPEFVLAAGKAEKLETCVRSPFHVILLIFIVFMDRDLALY
jgi:hypothetical protein